MEKKEKFFKFSFFDKIFFFKVQKGFAPKLITYEENKVRQVRLVRNRLGYQTFIRIYNIFGLIVVVVNIMEKWKSPFSKTPLQRR